MYGELLAAVRCSESEPAKIYTLNNNHGVILQ